MSEAICPKCNKPVEGSVESDNFDVYHPTCVTVDDLIELTLGPEKEEKYKKPKKLSAAERLKLHKERVKAKRDKE